MSRWRWGAFGLGAALLGLGLWKRDEIVSYLTFDPENFLPDKLMVPYVPLDISKFLESKGSYLLHVAPKGVPIAAIIDNACAKAGVNPRWLLVRLEIEQTLVTLTDATAAKWAATPKTWKEYDAANQPKTMTGTRLQYSLRWATGYAAFESGFKPVLFGRQMAGIENQIAETAAWTGRKFPLEKALLGKPLSVDGKTIVPKTTAARVAYLYTPHIKNGADDNYSVARRLFPEYMA